MTLCNYWDCDQNSAVESDVCRSHMGRFDAGLLDFCPDCNLLKSSDEPQCGECSTWTRFAHGDYEPIEYDTDEDEGDTGYVAPKSPARRRTKVFREFA